MSNKKTNSKSERIDKILVERGLISTRARAQAMILAGHVLVDDQPVTKAGELVSVDATIRLREPELKYVSRGALKLKAALEAFGVGVQGALAIDVGASTGGFTEILLERGAKKVFAVDVGTNQLAWKIRSDPRVVVQENINARFLKKEDYPSEGFDIAVMDVSFISIKLIIPSLAALLKSGAHYVVLFKPQFEVGKEHVGAGGIVEDQGHALHVMDQVIAFAKDTGFELLAKIDSPILGGDGNKEYLLCFKYK